MYRLLTPFIGRYLGLGVSSFEGFGVNFKVLSVRLSRPGLKR